MHNYNNQSSVSHFHHNCIVEPDMTTYITILLDCFPERTVTLDVESMITFVVLLHQCCCFVH